MRVVLGTAGYSYPEWVGGFYPPGTPQPRMLAYYATQFPAVELNFTFYRCPTPAMLLKLAGQAPPGFRFAVKLPRTVSHEQRADDLPMFRAAITELARADKFAGVVCQLPQTQRYERTNTAWIASIARELTWFRIGVEFRHRSWAADSVNDWLREIGVDLIAVDVPEIAALYPRGPAWSGDRLYARLHSRNAANWYADEKARYDYDYPEAVLREWLTGIQEAAASGVREAVVMFNNCRGTQAVDNARRLRELLTAEAPGLEVVPPPKAEPPRQRGLFDE